MPAICRDCANRLGFKPRIDKAIGMWRGECSYCHHIKNCCDAANDYIIPSIRLRGGKDKKKRHKSPKTKTTVPVISRKPYSQNELENFIRGRATISYCFETDGEYRKIVEPLRAEFIVRKDEFHSGNILVNGHEQSFFLDEKTCADIDGSPYGVRTIEELYRQW